ncbi:hypothetical protein I316_07028 [Kwoniella heveanensis BCC8398]|uniref:Uncharacterized protein n=1 Tax=Kwoniella heveanensis BCC8398 TaxID=1296120 RepID=A0A1B9GJV9_9TREE|nr:hypothetical protein I316_07028 [Kwoniella heveanensis BCC8398]
MKCVVPLLFFWVPLHALGATSERTDPHTILDARNIPSSTNIALHQSSSSPTLVEGAPFNGTKASSAPLTAQQTPPVGAFSHTRSAVAVASPSTPLLSPITVVTSSSKQGGILSSILQDPPPSLVDASDLRESLTSPSPSFPGSSPTAVLKSPLSSSTAEVGAYENPLTTSDRRADFSPSSALATAPYFPSSDMLSPILGEPSDTSLMTSTRLHLTTDTTTLQASGLVGAQETSAVYNGDAAGTISPSEPGGGIGEDDMHTSVFTVVSSSTLYQVVKGHPTPSASGVVGAQVDGGKQWVQQGQWLRAACASGAADPKVS